MIKLIPGRDVNVGGVRLQKGAEYLFFDKGVGPVLEWGERAEVRSTTLVEEGLMGLFLKILSGRLDTLERLLVVRPGAMGDLLFLTPLLRWLKGVRGDGLEITVCCARQWAQIFEGNDDVTGVMPYPPRVDETREGYDAIFWWEGIAPEMNMVDAVFKVAGVDPAEVPPGMKELVWRVTECEARWANLLAPRTQARRAGVHGMSSSLCRNWDFGKLQAVILTLLERGWEVYVFGAPGEAQFTEELPGLVNLTAADPALGLRQSAALMQMCDVFLGPDSGPLHLAGALGVPAVGLFGPIASDLRVRYARSITGIDGEGECAGCGWHELPMMPFPMGSVKGKANHEWTRRGTNGNGKKDWPCARSGRCEVLAGIDHGMVIERMLEVARVRLYEG